MWFSVKPDQRIIEWRKWRNSLAGLPAETVLVEVAKEWARVPQVMHYLSPDLPDDWPTAWQLVHNNVYCDLSIVLGMFYTIALLEHPDLPDPEIHVYRTPDGWHNLSSVASGKYVLNYDVGSVVNSQRISKTAELIFVYSKVDLFAKFN